MDPLLNPIWEGDEIIEESAMPFCGNDGRPEPVRLLYRASSVLSVQSADRTLRFREGPDYLLRDGCLFFPETTAVPVVSRSEYYPASDDGHCFPHTDGGFILFAESDGIHRRQIVITYRHEDRWKGPVPADKSGLLPRTLRLLAEGGNLNLLIFGDSISTGANASGIVNVPPYQKPWYDLAADAIRGRYRSARIRLINTSVGGTMSEWGRETAAENGAAQHPDLCVLGFGMNDGSHRVPPDEFVGNLRAIMGTIRAENPDCEFILIATTLANPEVRGFAGLQPDYLVPMLGLETRGVCVADMTSMHAALLRRKPFRDLTGNNVNHPNDFLSRVQAQVLLRTLGVL